MYKYKYVKENKKKIRKKSKNNIIVCMLKSFKNKYQIIHFFISNFNINYLFYHIIR